MYVLHLAKLSVFYLFPDKTRCNGKWNQICLFCISMVMMINPSYMVFIIMVCIPMDYIEISNGDKSSVMGVHYNYHDL